MYRRYSVNIVRVTRYETEYQVVFSGMEKKKKNYYSCSVGVDSTAEGVLCKGKTRKK